jgi:A/G-specific adenine glycosylase
MPAKLYTFSHKLLSWYNIHARELPFRKTKDPYTIWVSEIIFQQTSIKQGLPYFNNFLSLFPDLKTLAQADEDLVLKAWQGLGYYSRARNLHFTARDIYDRLDGVFPDNYDALLKLKGVGPYTAAAISSFCFNEAKVVVDGNVKRFISRIHGITDPVDKAKTEKRILELATKEMPLNNAGTYNQALMEMGALLCTPSNPGCNACPFKSDCVAFNKKLVSQIPSKSKRTNKKNRYFYFAFIVDNNNQTLIYKRGAGDIWTSLYTPPLIESKTSLDKPPSLGEFGFNYAVNEVYPSKLYKHVLTHQTIIAQFLYFSLDEALSSKNLKNCFKAISLKKLDQFAVPRLVDLYLGDLSITLF